MPVTPVAGPAGGGKSQWIARRRQPGDVVIDYTLLYAALMGAVRDPATGKYPVRPDGDPAVGITTYLMATAVRYASDNGLSGYVTTSRRAKVDDLEEMTGQPAVIIDPGEAVAPATSR